MCMERCWGVLVLSNGHLTYLTSGQVTTNFWAKVGQQLGAHMLDKKTRYT